MRQTRSAVAISGVELPVAQPALPVLQHTTEKFLDKLAHVLQMLLIIQQLYVRYVQINAKLAQRQVRTARLVRSVLQWLETLPQAAAVVERHLMMGLMIIVKPVITPVQLALI